ncbi:methionine adenosyltransferase domain-containing protein [Thalassovita taeanensis]|uniref:Methionine adenosyltransferase n=1 Tax=Thalassovita taeanensis TaxID=657014 RepID=A0A1H9EM50_9RHOB|nr:methionine adenosyltransferase domain-containing protein [Thalassovita taeanensis]SEQ26826.1 methionine adenosyltransferase [Thalassovita taeanensis]
MRDFVMTSESVTLGHPDKLCDQISDAVIDACLTADVGRNAVAECAVATGVVFLSVRGLPEPPCDLAALARRVIAEAGYDHAMGDGAGPTVMLDLATDGGAADARRGQMTTAFGFACDHTEQAIPLPIWAAHRLTRALDAARQEQRLTWLSPDAQAQVAVSFRNRIPVGLPGLAFAFGTTETVNPATIEAALHKEVITPAFAGGPIAPDPATRLVWHAIPGVAGPEAHSGQTGRKTADDTYGGYSRQSSAALSGKGPARIDRTAQYAARQAARLVLAAGLARECEVQLSYILGDEAPASIEVDTFGTGAAADEQISRRLASVLDFRVGAIAERMGLWTRPAAQGGRFYRDLATYGHMARDDIAAPWEDVTLASALA